jgi:hypothetical protein
MLSQTIYTGDGLTSTYTISFNYIEKSHVKAYLNGTQTSFTWDSPTLIRLSSPPAEDVILLIKRETPTNQRLVDFETSSLTDSKTFNTEGDQEFFLSQELIDDKNSRLGQGVSLQWDAQNKQIKNLPALPVDPNDAASKHYVDKGSLDLVNAQVATAASYVYICQDKAVIATDKADIAIQAADDALLSASNAAVSETNAETFANSINPNTLIHTQASGLLNPGYTKTEVDTTFYNKTEADTLLTTFLQTSFNQQWPIGSTREWLSNTMPYGTWLILNGQSIGDASSGATARANADTESLFTYLWTNIAQTDLPIQDSTGAASTRGASAAADFAAHKRMPLIDMRDMFWRGKSASRALGSYEADEFKSHAHNYNDKYISDITPANYDWSDNNANVTDHARATGETGGTETRPKNRAVNMIIRY